MKGIILRVDLGEEEDGYESYDERGYIHVQCGERPITAS